MVHRKVEVRDFVKLPLILYAIVGIRLFKWNPKDSLNIYERIGRVAVLGIVLYSGGSIALFLIYDTIDTALDATAMAIYVVFLFNSLAKVITVLIGRNELKILLKKMVLKYPQTGQGRIDYQVEAFYRKIRRYNVFVIIFHFMTTSMFNGFPIVQSLMEYLTANDDDEQFKYRFPYMLWYTFDVERPFRYLLAYIHQCLGAYTCSCFFLGSDLLLITVVHLINMHFTYLGTQIQQFEPTGGESDVQYLGTLVEYHEEILSYAELVDSIFSVSILLNYIGTCFIICLIAIQVVAGTEFFSLIKFFAFLISTFMHIYLISIFGNDMIILSTGISDEFCQQSWYMANNKYQRMLPLPIARAQRSAHLTALKFFDISMESLKTLITTSYQLFTLIKTRMDETLA